MQAVVFFSCTDDSSQMCLSKMFGCIDCLRVFVWQIEKFNHRLVGELLGIVANELYTFSVQLKVDTSRSLPPSHAFFCLQTSSYHLLVQLPKSCHMVNDIFRYIFGKRDVGMRTIFADEGRRPSVLFVMPPRSSAIFACSDICNKCAHRMNEH